jgi:hypothetical protein
MTTAQILSHPRAASAPVVNPKKWCKPTTNVVSIRRAANKHSMAPAPDLRQENLARDERRQFERARRIVAMREAIAMFDARPGSEDVAKSARRHLENDLYEQAAYLARLRVGAAQAAQGKVCALGDIQ